jgi:hypothetical protein
VKLQPTDNDREIFSYYQKLVLAGEASPRMMNNMCMDGILGANQYALPILTSHENECKSNIDY